MLQLWKHLLNTLWHLLCFLLSRGLFNLLKSTMKVYIVTTIHIVEKKVVTYTQTLSICPNAFNVLILLKIIYLCDYNKISCPSFPFFLQILSCIYLVLFEISGCFYHECFLLCVFVHYTCTWSYLGRKKLHWVISFIRLVCRAFFLIKRWCEQCLL